MIESLRKLFGTAVYVGATVNATALTPKGNSDYTYNSELSATRGWDEYDDSLRALKAGDHISLQTTSGTLLFTVTRNRKLESSHTGEGSYPPVYLIKARHTGYALEGNTVAKKVKLPRDFHYPHGFKC